MAIVVAKLVEYYDIFFSMNSNLNPFRFPPNSPVFELHILKNTGTHFYEPIFSAPTDRKS